MRQKKQNRQNDILFILISSFVVVVVWIGFNIYHIHVTSTISQHIQYQLTPVSPNFNQEVMQQLTKRKNVNPLFEQQGAATLSATQTSQNENSVTPALSGEPNASQSSGVSSANEASNGQGQ